MLDLDKVQVHTKTGDGLISFFDGEELEVLYPDSSEEHFQYIEHMEDGLLKAEDEYVQHAINRDIMLQKRLHVVRYQLIMTKSDKSEHFQLLAEQDSLEKKLRSNEYKLLKHRYANDRARRDVFLHVLEGPEIEAKLSRFILDSTDWLVKEIDETIAQVDVEAEVDVWMLTDLAYAYISEAAEQLLMVNPDRLREDETKVAIDCFLHMDPSLEGAAYLDLLPNSENWNARLLELRELLFEAARPDLHAYLKKRPSKRIDDTSGEVAPFSHARKIISDKLILATDRSKPADLASAIFASFVKCLSGVITRLGSI